MVNKQQFLKQGGIVLAALVVIVAIIVLVTFVLGGSNRMLTSEELALEQTRIALNIYIKQTEVALTSTAGLYLTLGVPMPTETPFMVPTSGALGRDTRTPTAEDASGGNGIVTGPGQRTQASQTGTLPAAQQTQAQTATLAAGQPTWTPTTTTPTGPADTQPTGWGGEWIAWYGAEWEDIQTGVMSVTVSGRNLSAVVELIGGTMTLTGEITEDGQQVYGEYTFTTGAGVFFWELIENGTQFWGNADNNRNFCAARPGQAQPEQCGFYFDQ